MGWSNRNSFEYIKTRIRRAQQHAIDLTVPVDLLDIFLALMDEQQLGRHVDILFTFSFYCQVPLKIKILTFLLIENFWNYEN